jgi:hypothetical protein
MSFSGTAGSGSASKARKRKEIEMKTVIVAMVLAVGAGTGLAQEAEKRGRVDVVFCIDRSGSMQGVIETAKQKVWGIVNEIAKSKPSPILRIGLIGYGSADRDIKFFQLSDDLDKVYENLLTFKVDMGGDEWVGWAARQAAERMEWSQEKGALKIIFMVGNETAAQGRAEVQYTNTIPEVVKKDITVNAIYCGNPNPEEGRTWMEVAKLADGIYTTIDLSGGAITIETPHDKKLVELNQKLNATYVGFGRHGAEGKLAQEAQDRRTAVAGAPAAAERAAAKGKEVYSNARWDLVDACKDKNFKIEELKDEDLPQELRGKTAEEKKAYVEKLKKDREAIQKEINETDSARAKYLQEEIRKRNLNTSSAFDEAVRSAVRKQAEKRGFTFEEQK